MIHRNRIWVIINMKGGIKSLVWFNDRNGKEYLCSLGDHEIHSFEDLSEEERKQCADVNQIVVTARL